MSEGAENREAEPGFGRATLLHLAGRVARGADRALTALTATFLVLVLLFACYALWDTWRIYDAAGVDEGLLKYKPTLDNSESLAELTKINPDVCAWLTIDGTSIDYPVVQGDDNFEYLNTDVRGDFSLSGSIFLDCRNARDFADPYSLVYGHHMEGGAMFGALDSFADEEFFNEHAEGVLFLPDRALGIEVFALVKTDAYDEQFFNPGDLQEAEMEALVERVKSDAMRFRDIGIDRSDKIIALSTCADAGTAGRTVVLGRLSELEANEGEVKEKE